MARRLNKEIPGSIILDQYSNPNNPLAHYEGTAEEIIAACGDRLDMIVIGAGTGGTISGVAKRLKEVYKNLIVVGVDPVGSILSNPSDLENVNEPYHVEGIGYDFIPKVLDSSLIDSWIVTKDIDSFQMARRLIRSEGLLCGGSSGSITWAAIQAIKAYEMESDPSKRVLVILPDSVRNYMSKFLDPEWMFLHNFMSDEEFKAEQGFQSGLEKKMQWKWTPVFTIKITDSIEEIIKQIHQQQDEEEIPNWIPVIDPQTNKIIGNFDLLKYFKASLREGEVSVKQANITRFINKETFTTFSIEDDDPIKILNACACNSSVYLTDSEGKALLTESRCAQMKLSKLL